MTRTVRLNLLNLFLLIVLMLALTINIFEGFSIYLIMILPIIMLIIGIYVLIQILKNKILTKKYINKNDRTQSIARNSTIFILIIMLSN